MRSQRSEADDAVGLGGKDMSEVVHVYAGEAPPEEWNASIFLCGPTPRTADVPSWRPEARQLLDSAWTGPGRLVVFIPEARDGAPRSNYDDQRTWELYWGDRVDVVMFWIPRGPAMRGLTTNDEFGRWKDSGRVVLGTPPDAEHVRYQRDYAAEVHIPVADTLSDTVSNAVDQLGAGAHRAGGLRHVPLLIWRTPLFQTWITAQSNAGNELRAARMEWCFRIGPAKAHVLFAVMHVEMFVAAENRVKANEVMLARPDISCVMAFWRAPDPLDSKIVIVREYRSPATTPDAFIRELPGGSSFKETDPAAAAVAELFQETGIKVPAERLRLHHTRQAAGTVSTHQMHLYSVELSDQELAAAAADSRTHGEAIATEQTHVEIHTYRELLTSRHVDWTTLGAISQVLLSTDGQGQ